MLGITSIMRQANRLKKIYEEQHKESKTLVLYERAASEVF
jgi:hypothetical protein